MRTALTAKTITSPKNWEALVCGNRYRQTLEQQLEPWLNKLYGLHFIKLGHLSCELDTERCSISHQINVATTGETSDVYADLTQLPFLSKSVDACLLAQELNFTQDPHQILREIDRVLVDDGWLLLSGFMPFSQVGVAKCIPWLRKRPPFSFRLFTQFRLLDWLNLLNYEVIYQQAFNTIPWCSKGTAYIERYGEMAGSQMLMVARKRTIPLTMNKIQGLQKAVSIRSNVIGATQGMRADSSKDSE